MSFNDSETAQIADLVSELGLTADPSDAAALRLEVKNRISEIHPDHRPADPDERLQKLQLLLRRLGSEPTSLQLASPKTSLLSVESNLADLRNAVEKKVKAVGDSRKAVSLRSFLYPKISIAALTAALAWVFLFPKTFMSHPFIGPLLKGRFAVPVWIATVGCVTIAWLTIWIVEQAKQRKVEQLLSPSYQRSVLDRIGDDDEGSFSAKEFLEKFYAQDILIWYPQWVRALAKSILRRNIYYFRNPFYDVTLADEAAELALERFLAKGWIVRCKKPENAKGIDDWYRFR
jgi:hypothetical protein